MAVKKYISTSEVVKLSGRTNSEVIRLIKDGVIPGHQTKRGWWRFDKEAVMKYFGLAASADKEPDVDIKPTDTSLSPYKIALDIIENTSRNLLIVGKAGSGKTTFLRELVKHTKKTLSVVAPPGLPLWKLAAKPSTPFSDSIQLLMSPADLTAA